MFGPYGDIDYVGEDYVDGTLIQSRESARTRMIWWDDTIAAIWPESIDPEDKVAA